MMSNTVMALIGAAAACIAIGIMLFVSLKKASGKDGEDTKKLLDEDYIENFTQAFQATGTIEATLEQLADIYKNDAHMSAFIKKAYDYITDYDGDYETALSMINVDNDPQVEEAHRAALNKFLAEKHTSAKKTIDMPDSKEDTQQEQEDFADDDNEADGFEALKAKAKEEEEKKDEDFADDESGEGQTDDDDEDLKI